MSLPKRYKYTDGEVAIDMRYWTAGGRNENVVQKVAIMATGDLTHHIIEGIVTALKMIQRDNPHLEEI